MRDTKGTITYRIEEDGCLNGLYCNSYECEKVYNEIARKKSSTDDNDPLLGTYISSWIDIDDSVKIGQLEITKREDIYYLSWTINGKEVYNGTGKLTAENTLVAGFKNSK